MRPYAPQHIPEGRDFLPWDGEATYVYITDPLHVYEDVKEWLEENITGRFDTECAIYFQHRSDATLFYLRFR